MIDAIDLDFAEPVTLDFDDAAGVGEEKCAFLVFPSAAAREQFYEVQRKFSESAARAAAESKQLRGSPCESPRPAPINFLLRDYQLEALAKISEGWRQFRRQLAVLATGCGKCLGKGTPVLMFDGTIRRVESIVAGELLMGPDSKPRRVLSVCSGTEMLYRVTPTKGDPYVVNESHILSLKISGDRTVTIGNRRIASGQIANVTVREWLSSTRNFKHCAKGWRCGVSFSERRGTQGEPHVLLPAYILGVWLGDGGSTGAGFATVDSEIDSEICNYAKMIGHDVRREEANGKCPMLHVTTREKLGRGHRHNLFKRALHELNLIGNKHIPHSYATASARDRLDLLAGLMDTDGSRHGPCGYDFVNKNRRIAEGVCFVARSLGLAAYMKPCSKVCGNNGKRGRYYRVTISGDCHRIPCRIERKKCTPRRQKKSALVTGIRVEPIGIGEYFGFSIDGDRMFMLGDFTVTHNTIIFSQATAEEVSAGGRVLILAHTDELLDQASDKLARSTGLDAEKEKAEHHASHFAQVVVGSIQTLSRERRLLEWPEDHFTLVIVDEAHRSLAASYQKVLRYFHFGAASLQDGWEPPEAGVECKTFARILGVTATADRGDKRSLGEFYEACAFDYGLLQAVRDGYLVRPVAELIPLQIDLRGIKTSRSANGSDFDISEVTARITPFLREIARHVAKHAGDRKTVCFLPGVETARLLSEALRAEGLDASFVSGACPDRAEKLSAFDAAGRGSVMCNAMLLTEGWDCPDVSCVCVLRPTKIRSLYVQCVGRGTRPLAGVIDGLATAEERIAAIAASAKPDLRILDFLWLSDNLSLIKPIDLVATKPEIRERMLADGTGEQTDLVNLEMRAERDLLRSLEEAAKQHANKKGRVIDPLKLAVSLGDADLATWEPETKWDGLPPTPHQLETLARHGLDTTKIKTRGLASRLIGRVFERRQLGLCTPKQLNFLERLGVPDAALVSFNDATKLIDAKKKEREAERAAK